MQRELVSFAQGRGLTYIDEFTDDELGLLSRSWKSHPSPPRTAGTLALVFLLLRA